MQLYRICSVLLIFGSNLYVAKIHESKFKLEMLTHKEEKFIVQNGNDDDVAAKNVEDSRIHADHFLISIDSKNISSLYSCQRQKESKEVKYAQIEAGPIMLIDQNTVDEKVEDFSKKIDYFPISIMDAKEIDALKDYGSIQRYENFDEAISGQFSFPFLSLLFFQVLFILVYTVATKMKKCAPKKITIAKMNMEILRCEPESELKESGESNTTYSEESSIDDDDASEEDEDYLSAMASIKEKLAADLTSAPVLESLESPSNDFMVSRTFITSPSTVDQISMVDIIPINTALDESYYQNECVNLKKQDNSIQSYLKEYQAEVNAQQERDDITRNKIDERSKVAMEDLKSVTKALNQSNKDFHNLQSNYEMLKNELNERQKYIEDREEEYINGKRSNGGENEGYLMENIYSKTDDSDDEIFQFEAPALYNTPISSSCTSHESSSGEEDSESVSSSPDVTEDIVAESSRSLVHTSLNKDKIEQNEFNSPLKAVSRMNVYSQHLKDRRESKDTQSRLPRPVKRPLKRIDSPNSVTDSCVFSP